VETQAEFKRCQLLGFDYFQGYFLYKPHVVRARKIDSSREVIMHTLTQINNPHINYKDLEDFISRDVTITYKLLRLVNSAYYSNRVTVRSIRQAISLIGLERLRGWLTLLLITSSEHKPHELTITAITRAKFCELLAAAQRVDKKHLETYFVIGLFSLMDVFMDTNMEKAIQGLPLSDEIVEALLFRKGNTGRVLKAVLAYERGDLTKALELNITPEAVTNAFINTLHWVNSLVDVMAEITQVSVESAN
jgi:EAL and modified HD-GYP domain-containing signal transduction protein